eukprot:1127456-Prymnesium_polylepis.1
MASNGATPRTPSNCRRAFVLRRCVRPARAVTRGAGRAWTTRCRPRRHRAACDVTTPRDGRIWAGRAHSAYCKASSGIRWSRAEFR